LALEEDRLEDLPSMTQARGFIRLYADYLGLDPLALISRLSNSGKTEKPAPASNALKSPEKPKPTESTVQEPEEKVDEVQSDPALSIFKDIGECPSRPTGKVKSGN